MLQQVHQYTHRETSTFAEAALRDTSPNTGKLTKK
jgi:hypothetical protein